ncbi:L-aspartate oxidase [Aliifodinibius salicampi]|uniref:L-aspartate oxidase n=1 Tax=Fodinibius salicampi TaxID=1920655 RepID=A0ABT3Q3D2_9BACT|nr:L-aspartate oxidase [Fodinibius salicampi]
MNSTTISTDFLVIGSGAAGLSAALHASRYGKVHLVTKSNLEHSSSYWAQGGIAAVLDSDDSYKSHIKDTLEAGRGLCNTEAVELLVREGAHEIKKYIDLGMPFDLTNGELDLGLEGGHSNRRVLHANGAATGKALVEFLTELVKKEEQITVVEHAFIYQLFADEIECSGAAAYLFEEDKNISIESPATILATGGYSGLFQRSTNPHTSTGDGLWLGLDAGAKLQDLEFVQFHPTAFYTDDGSTFLISEALRGEGARLYNEEGTRFMEDYPRKELSPRDIVSGEILRQIRQQKENYVYLDLRHLDARRIREHFPNIISRIEAQGINIEKEGIPIAPAAHYCIGGLATDLDGCTSVKGLYACGEVAATGVHGANRLASNSLLECLVFSKRAIEHAVDVEAPEHNVPVANFYVDEANKDDFVQLQKQIASLLSNFVGIQRNKGDLEYIIEQVDQLSGSFSETSEEYFSIRSQGLLQLAYFISKAALKREESRGVHQRTDFPDRWTKAKHLSFENSIKYTGQA